MFCFQCEQTAFSTGCTSRGVCGKKSDVSDLQDELINSIAEFAMYSCQNKKTADERGIFLVIKCLFATITNVNFDNTNLTDLISEVKNMTREIKSDVSYDFKFDIKNVFCGKNENIKSLKSLILFALKGIAAYAFHSRVLGYKESEIDEFFFEALNALAEENDINKLVDLVTKTGFINLKAVELLDKANTETYGNPVMTPVSMTVEKGPFIVVTGHDLRDLYLLLEQTKDKGINIYTHGEMLCAHGYPKLKEFPHLRGNFGTAWQNQQKEFKDIPAPILFTTNCIMPPLENYIDRVFTTSIVRYPKTVYIDEKKDYSILIKKALELGGYKEDKTFTGINGGSTLTVGFGHDMVLSIKDKIIDCIKSGKIKHIFLVGGCDGAMPGRNYYRDFVKLIPSDCLVLTLACGKYRFNDLDLGNIEGIPRLIDMGQCNDSYSAVKVALELAKALNCTVDELPLHFVLSWYEQKAVSVLLTLLALEIKNIKLGPTLPAFLKCSEYVLKYLAEKYKIKPITNPKDDLEEMLSRE